MSLSSLLFGGSAAVLGFGLLVLIHELGHFLALKSAGLPVHAFSIGFGNPIWSRKWHDTEYRLGWIPLGGYVMSEDPEAVEARCEAGGPVIPPTPPLTQIYVALMGPVANLVLAVIFFFAITTGWGEPLPAPIVDALVNGSPAATAGLQPGDRVIRLNGEPITTWPGMIAAIQTNGERSGDFEIERNGSTFVMPIVPAREGDRFVLGIRPRFVHSGPVSPLPALQMAFTRTLAECQGIIATLGRLFTFSGAGQVAGPIAILHQTFTAAVGGLPGFLTLLAILSVNLAVFNLLPIPPLDGLRIMIAGWELAFRRPLSEQLLMPIYQWGAIGLATVFLLVTLKDIGGFLL